MEEIKTVQGMDIDLAHQMVNGDINGPVQCENYILVALRITGTGKTTRTYMGRSVVFNRPAGVFQSEKFLEMCNGLPVALLHPQDGQLDYDNWKDYIAGSIMLPFNKGAEVWGIAKIFDKEAIKRVYSKQWSTSPYVTSQNIPADGGEYEEKLEDINHVAIVPAGHWDVKEKEPAIAQGDIAIKEAEPMSEEVKRDAGNTVKYQGVYCPFRWVGDDLEVFYKGTWIKVDPKDVKSDSKEDNMPEETKKKDVHPETGKVMASELITFERLAPKDLVEKFNQLEDENEHDKASQVVAEWIEWLHKTKNRKSDIDIPASHLANDDKKLGEIKKTAEELIEDDKKAKGDAGELVLSTLRNLASRLRVAATNKEDSKEDNPMKEEEKKDVHPEEELIEDDKKADGDIPSYKLYTLIEKLLSEGKSTSDAVRAVRETMPDVPLREIDSAFEMVERHNKKAKGDSDADMSDYTEAKMRRYIRENMSDTTEEIIDAMTGGERVDSETHYKLYRTAKRIHQEEESMIRRNNPNKADSAMSELDIEKKDVDSPRETEIRKRMREINKEIDNLTPDEIAKAGPKWKALDDERQRLHEELQGILKGKGDANVSDDAIEKELRAHKENGNSKSVAINETRQKYGDSANISSIADRVYEDKADASDPRYTTKLLKTAGIDDATIQKIMDKLAKGGSWAQEAEGEIKALLNKTFGELSKEKKDVDKPDADNVELNKDIKKDCIGGNNMADEVKDPKEPEKKDEKPEVKEPEKKDAEPQGVTTDPIAELSKKVDAVMARMDAYDAAKAPKEEEEILGPDDDDKDSLVNAVSELSDAAHADIVIKRPSIKKSDNKFDYIRRVIAANKDLIAPKFHVLSDKVDAQTFDLAKDALKDMRTNVMNKSKELQAKSGKGAKVLVKTADGAITDANYGRA